MESILGVRGLGMGLGGSIWFSFILLGWVYNVVSDRMIIAAVSLLAILGLLFMFWLYFRSKHFKTPNPHICVILGSGGHTT